MRDRTIDRNEHSGRGPPAWRAAAAGAKYNLTSLVFFRKKPVCSVFYSLFSTVDIGDLLRYLLTCPRNLTGQPTVV